VTLNTALILAAHGARDCPQVGDVIRQWAASIAEKTDFAAVVTAFNQDQPHFREVIDQLLERHPDINRAVVVPVMTSSGYFADEFLPHSLSENKRADDIAIRITIPLGTHPHVEHTVTRRVEHLANVFDFDLATTTIIVVGHGTKRNSTSSRSTEQLTRRISQHYPQSQVRAAFLDQDPTLEDVARSTPTGDILVIPFLISPGPHAQFDIPNQIRTATVRERPTIRTATVRDRPTIQTATASDRPTIRTATVRERPESDDANTPRIFPQNNRRILIDRPTGLDPQMIDCIIDLANPPKTGSVHLVGAGPGDPGLITVKGAQLLATADAIVHDRLIPFELLSTARPGARIINVAKHADGAGASQRKINRIIIRLARRGMSVVRLKGGDPFVFGRGFEEYVACRAANVPCHVICGVSSAIAAPAAANIPITCRRLARSVAIVTASFADGVENPLDFQALARIDTVVILMGTSRLKEMSRGLIDAGKPPSTPAACIENATTPRQRVIRAELAGIAAKAESVGLRAPTVTIVGDVAALSGDPIESAVTGVTGDVAIMS